MNLSGRSLALLLVSLLCAALTLSTAVKPEFDKTFLLLAIPALLLEVRAVPGTRHGPFSCAASFYLAALLTPQAGPSGTLAICSTALLARALFGPPPRLPQTYLADFTPLVVTATGVSFLTGKTALGETVLVFIGFLLAGEFVSSLLYPLFKPTRVTRTRFALASIMGAVPAASLSVEQPLVLPFLGILMLIVQNGSYMKIRQEALTETARSLKTTKKDLLRARKETDLTGHKLDKTAKERELVENLAKYFARNPNEQQVLNSCLEAVEPLFPRSLKIIWRQTAQGFKAWPNENSAASRPPSEELRKCREQARISVHSTASQTHILAPIPDEGVLQITTAPTTPTTNRLDLLTILTSQFGLGLQSAKFRGHLHEALELQRETNRKLQESQAQLLQSSKMAAVGQLAAGVAHELNSPLAAALLQVQMGKMRLESGAYEKVSKSLETTELSINLAQEIIDKLLGFSRAGESEHTPIELGRVAHAAYELVRENLEADGVAVAMECEDEVWVNGAPTQLQQVVVNLLMNARYASLQNRGERLPQIKLTVQKASDQAALIVSDSGAGVPEEIATRIFEPFFTTKPIGEGTGLGLSISFEILKTHKGTLELRNSNEGAHFRVLLPLQK